MQLARGPALVRHRHATSLHRTTIRTPQWHHRPVTASSSAAAGDGGSGADGIVGSIPSLPADADSSPTTSSSLAAVVTISSADQGNVDSSQRPVGGEAPSDEPPAEASTSSASSTHQMPDADVEKLWNSVTRALLRVGKAGFQPSHLASLRELLASHALVKVQLNDRLADGVSIEADVAAPAGAVFLKRKGKTLLFAPGGLGAEQLLAAAVTNVERKQWATQKRAEARQPPPPKKERAAAASSAPASGPRQEMVLPPLPDEGSQLALNRVLQRVAGGPLDRSALLLEHEQVVQQLDTDEPPPTDRQQRRGQRPWQQKKRGPGRSGPAARPRR